MERDAGGVNSVYNEFHDMDDPCKGVTPEEDGGVEHIRVVARVRPFLPEEAAVSDVESVIVCDNGGVEVSLPAVGDTTDCVKCSYDGSLGPDATQEMLYGEVRGCVSAVLRGINATCFAYGTTGSGKTYSLYGPHEFTREDMHWGESGCHPQAGVVPRTIADIFKGLRKTSQSLSCNNKGWLHEWGVWCSMIQVYNEQVYDMLRDPQRVNPLTIRTEEGEYMKGGGFGGDDVGKASVYCDGLIECSVTSANECLELISMAESHRVIRETHRNVVSSRSHSILQILVEQHWVGGGGKKRRCCAKLNIVDLAGSEKWNVLQESNSEKISELTHINTSLHALGRVVAALSSSSSTSGSAALMGEAAKISKSDVDKGDSSQRDVGSEAAVPSLVPRSHHIPYRDSKLTRLLQDSLGGNTRTRLIATLSPTVTSAHESVSTLRFADRAKKVVSFVKVNDRPSIAAGGEEKELIRRLRSEVVQLRGIVRELMFKKDSPAKTESRDATPAVAGSGGALSPRRKGNNLEVLEVQIEHLKKENAELRNQLAQTGTAKSPTTVMQPQQQSRLAAMEKAMSSIMTSLHNFFHYEIEEPELKEAMEVAQGYLRASEMTMKNKHPENRILSDISGGSSTTLPSLQSNNKHREVVTAKAGGMGGGVSSSAVSTHFGGFGSAMTDDQQPPLYHKGVSRGGAAPLLLTTQRPSSPIAFRVRGRGGHVHTSQMLLRGQTEELDDEENEQKLRQELHQAKLKVHKKLALQDWVKQKEEVAIRAKEEDRVKMYEKEKEKLKSDEDFRRRAAAVKKKLKNYYAELQAKEKADVTIS